MAIPGQQRRIAAGMRRREFFALVGGAAVAWSVVARAQQPTMPVIGFLSAVSPSNWSKFVGAFR